MGLHNQKKVLNEISLDNINQVKNTFYNLEERDTKILSTALEVVTRDPGFKQIYMEKNREKLSNYGQPLFQNLKNKSGITHFYFILPDSHVFVRLHNKEIYGDPVKRTALQKAKETKKLSSGIELGKTAFALRAVMPYYNDVELIGYVELGEEIDHFLKILKGKTNNEFAIIADKEHLDREDWKSVRQVAGLRDNWDDLEKHLILTSTTVEGFAAKCFSENNLERIEEGENLFPQFEIRNQTFICGGFFLNDAEGQHLGAVLSLIDITDHLAVAQKVNRTILGVTMILSVITLTMGIFISRSISKPITKLKDAANKIGKGNLNTKIDVNSKDEIGELANSFKGMAENLQIQLSHLKALRAIDRAIIASIDLRVTLDILLEKVITELSIDAATVLLLNQHTQVLEYVASRGFRSSALKYTKLRLGESNAGRAAIERRIVTIPNLKEEPDGFIRSKLFSDEDFITYFAVPLIAKGQVKGVLEIFHRALLDADPDWLEFLEAIAGQAAIAIDNATLFEDLQRSNIELTLAYDTTIEGWSRAMDLRDKETEGHTQRVTEMTFRIAREFGVKEEELVHIRRGALLHDMGKMGVPDGILLKPGPLTDEEWKIMKRHPEYAYEMLYPIEYLRPALDIPYCHHEKWDGSGYPRRLKGEEIPLAARIFAVVDVWDALCSDRPYRAGWPKEKVREHIHSLSGIHFDPRVVEVFLKTEW